MVLRFTEGGGTQRQCLAVTAHQRTQIAWVAAVVNGGPDNHSVKGRRIQTCRKIVCAVCFGGVALATEPLRDTLRDPRGLTLNGCVED